MSRRIPCFKSHKHAMFDTPGLFPSHRYTWPIDAMDRAAQPEMVRPLLLRLRGHTDVAKKQWRGRVTVKNMPIWLDIEVEEPVRPRNLNVVWYSGTPTQLGSLEKPWTPPEKEPEVG